MRFREVTERYRLDKILRSTRTGTVLRAVDSQSGQTVAVKMITVGPSPGFPEVAPKFQALVGALAGVAHPGLPPVLDSGFTPDGSAFLVFPFLEGRGFETLTGGAPARVLPLLVQALDALEALAAQGVSHHNLSPDNLWLVDAPGGPQVKLLGVGTAIFQTPDGPNARFRAPELGDHANTGDNTADPRADLYSFALTACKGLGATESLGDGRDPVVQMPFALSFELENAEGIRQVLELCLRQDPAQRPAPAVIREAFRPALNALAADSGGEESWQDSTDAPAWQEKTAPILFPDLETAMPAAISPAAVVPQPSTPALAPFPTLPPLGPVAPSPALPAFPVSPALPPLEAPTLSPPASFSPPMSPTMAAAQAGPSLASGGLGAAAAPVAPTFPDPDPDGDLFPEITDDILNALPTDWQPGTPAAASPARVLPFGKGKAPTPAGAAGAAEGETPAEGPAAAAPPATVPLLRRPALLGGAAAVLLLLVAGAVWLATRSSGGDAPNQAVAGGPAVPAGPVRRPAAERLEEARLLFAEGKDYEVRRLLAAFTAADQAELSAEQCAILGQLEQTLALSARDRMPQDLKTGLDGDLVRLRNAVATADAAPGDVPAALQEDLGKARRAVGLYAQAEEAARDKKPVAVLERLGSLDALIPGFTDPKDLREQAAAALEAEAKALVDTGRYEPAVAYLQPIQSTWPDRPGFAELIASYQGFQRAEQSQKTLLEQLATIERRRKPHEGLEALEGVEPVPNLAPRFTTVRQRLETQLTQLDQQPPKVVLRDGFYLEYSRGAVVNLSFRVTDDYEVRSVKMMARSEGGKMREVPLKKSTFGYDAVIPQSIHQNGTVDFYVAATDRSGHEGSYGSSSQPAQLKRVGGGRF